MSYSNPFTGASWGSTPADANAGGSVVGNTLFTPSQQPNNPLLGWAGSNVNQGSSSLPQAPTVTGPPTGAWGNPAGLENPGSNQKDNMRNEGYINVMLGQLREQLAPIWANLLTGYAAPAANYFNTLMNLGSPYYQQKQASVFDQGVQQNQNAAAATQQQLASRGYGYTPSGVNAATIGAMNMAGGANLVQNYLNSLFQNEQLQTAGAQGLAGLAGMFNPSGLFGNVEVTGSTQGPSAAGEVAGILSGAGSLLGGFGSLGQGAAGLQKLFGCWIARAVYGEHSPTAEHIRQRLWTLAARNPIYSALMGAYLTVGENIAEKVKRVPALREAFRSLFNQFLADENKWPIGMFFELLCAEGNQPLAIRN
jgi:hypothetical protein